MYTLDLSDRYSTRTTHIVSTGTLVKEFKGRVVSHWMVGDMDVMMRLYKKENNFYINLRWMGMWEPHSFLLPPEKARFFSRFKSIELGYGK